MSANSPLFSLPLFVASDVNERIETCKFWGHVNTSVTFFCALQIEMPWQSCSGVSVGCGCLAA